MNAEEGKVAFPYATLAEATKDKFAKIGGPAEAFRFLVKGYKSILWRKRAEANAKQLQDAEDAAFAEENAPKPLRVAPQAKPVLPAPAPKKKTAALRP
jgi:hypothetical protein